jgi:CRISPR-associated protein Cmr5
MSTLRSHQVAQLAYNRVLAHKDQQHKKAYGALAIQFPLLILHHGLAQSSGFLLAKKETHHLALLDDIAAVLNQTFDINTENREALHQRIIAANLSETIVLTRRILEICGWLKRYAQGVLKIDATGESIEQDTEHSVTITEADVPADTEVRNDAVNP